MKALYLGFNRSYVNPSGELILRAIGNITRLDYFGPGFTTKETLAQGINSWIDRHGPYSFLVADSFVVECENIMKRERPFWFSHIRFRPQEYFDCAGEFKRFFLQYAGPKLFIANLDPYTVARELVDQLVESEAYVIDGGITTNRSKEETEHTYRTYVAANTQSHLYKLATNHWYDFVTKHRHKVIALPHFASTSEFDFAPLAGRSHTFSVLGAGYPERKAAKRLLTGRQFTVDVLGRMKYKIRERIRRPHSALELAKYRASYLNQISGSKLCYCSGSPLLYAVKKYFEIPARGAVAIGLRCNGFDDLGFVDRENFVVARNDTEIEDVLAHYDELEYQAIADRGRALVWNAHSEWARTKQLAQSLGLIAGNRFVGSYWRNGVYEHYE